MRTAETENAASACGNVTVWKNGAWEPTESSFNAPDTSDRQPQLRIFFTGWGTDARLMEPLRERLLSTAAPEALVIVSNPSISVEAPTPTDADDDRTVSEGEWPVLTTLRRTLAPLLQRDPDVTLSAWSFGVRVAADALERGFDFGRLTEVAFLAGTTTPVSDDFGIPPETVRAMADALAKGARGSYVRFLHGTAGSRAAWDAWSRADALTPQIPLCALTRELFLHLEAGEARREALLRTLADLRVPLRLLLPTEDRIFPPASQNAWSLEVASRRSARGHVTEILRPTGPHGSPGLLRSAVFGDPIREEIP